MTGEELVAPLTAVLFAAGEPQTPEKLCGIFDCGQDVLEAAFPGWSRRLAGRTAGSSFSPWQGDTVWLLNRSIIHI